MIAGARSTGEWLRGPMHFGFGVLRTHKKGPRHPRKVVTWAEIQAMGPKDKKNGAKGLRSRLKAYGITGLTGKPTAVMRNALALRLGITVPQAPAPIAPAPAALVPVDWSNDADESEEEEEIQEERARAMDESEDENSDLWN